MSCPVSNVCVCLRLLWAALLLAIAGVLPAQAQTNVDLQLVLAVDASGSVNDTRFELQKQGYAAAFRNPQVIKAIMSGGEQAIAVTMMQWTGPFMHVQVVPWTLVKDAASAKAFGDAVAASQRRRVPASLIFETTARFNSAFLADRSLSRLFLRALSSIVFMNAAD